MSLLISYKMSSLHIHKALARIFVQVLKRKSNSCCRLLSTMPEKAQKPAKNTVDENEIHHFDRLAKGFWDEQAETRPLLAMNKLRVPFVRDGLLGMKQASESTGKDPLEGYHILDVGCGAGILSEALARIGANVTGIDASKELINVACAHVKQDPAITDKITYIYGTIEEHAQQKQSFYDAVVASEVIEHITEKETFVESCVSCLKPGGSVFITTPNRTLVMWAVGIMLFEYVFRAIPRGTHELNKCIKPHELSAMLERYGCTTKLTHGMIYNFMKNEWYWSSVKSAVYALHAVKRK